MLGVLSCVTLVGLAFVSGSAFAQQSAPFVVVVNEANPVDSLSVYKVSRLFQKKVTRWQSGQFVEPVDLPDDSGVRSQFTRSVHARSVREIQGHWHRQTWAGRAVPPLELPTDSDVLAFVSSNPDAIGYVSAQAGLPDGVKILHVRGAR